MRKFHFLFALLIAAMFALTPAHAASLPAPSFGSITLPQGTNGSTGNVGGMSINPGTSPLLRTLQGRAGDDVHLEDWCSNLSASGADVTACLQAAADAAALTGRCLSVPYTPPSAVYWTLSAMITIGNGSGGTASTKPGGCIRGAGSGGLYGARGSYFRWTGPAGGTMMQVNGPIENVSLQGFNLNGANTAARLIKFGAMRFSDVRDIWGAACTQSCFGVYGLPAGGSLNVMLEFSKLYISTDQPGAIAFDFDGVLSNSTDTWLSTVRNSRFESTGANGTALRLGFSDNILFEQIHAIVNSSNGGCGVKFDASTSGNGGNSYPGGHLFVKSALDNTCVVEDGSHTIGVNNFVDLGTTDNEAVPSHPSLRGTTDQGYSFGGWGGPGSWQTFAPTITAITPGSPAAAFSSTMARYAVSGKHVDASYTVAQTATGTGAGTAVSISLPVTPRTSSSGMCFGREDSATGKSLQGLITGGTSVAIVRAYDGTYPVPSSGSTMGRIILSCAYEAQ